MHFVAEIWPQLESLVPTLLIVLMTLFFVGRYLRKHNEQDQRARKAAEEAGLYSHGPQAQHPQIDESRCIGCATCTTVCPEGDVLGMLGGKAAFIKPQKCIGHGMCAEACPVGAITMMMASPHMNTNLPRLTPQFETNIPNLFVIGELGGLALIKNAVSQGRETIDTIAGRVAGDAADDGAYDVLIVGAGPAGISASLRAIERQLSYVTLEEGDIGGTVSRYPRQKLVMTSPVEFPLYGKFKKTELSKEDLLEFWTKVMRRADFRARTQERVMAITMQDGHTFAVSTSKAEYRARAVVLAMGKSGTPRKLEVPGEDLPKVMYRLIEADHYTNKQILVVGGGDSAVEAAMGLSFQKGNRVTLSYRQGSFTRIKERNARRLEECKRSGKVNVLLNSHVREIRKSSVLLETENGSIELANDYVWVFAGGVAPYDFLRKIGVTFGGADLVSMVESAVR